MDEPKHSCCTPSRDAASAAGTPEPGPDAPGTQGAAVHDDVALAGGRFLMGDPFGEGYASDGETPVHPVEVDAFRMDATAVTNAMFARFVTETGFRTDAERYGSSAVFHLLSTADAAAVAGSAAGAPWWLNVLGADWAHPTGPDSSWEQIPDHPVVHVSYDDALAYCRWAGRRLPTEAEWEYAARGGLEQARFAWGDELTPGGQHRCNIFQGEFPTRNTAGDGFAGTAPVRSFPANGYGLYEVAGNVWEWCADWFMPKYYKISPVQNPPGPSFGTGRVMRGGSYLCHDSYCHRYRVAARSANTAESSSGNCGFRTVAL
ncbi:formylglycine-generating enzyme family protein [Zhihengliuella flava]|uniref:Formylglycine-generating enzyme required for sulfatase activity n=1 Tax=Zhihengliuella flava TaxID=1285193 RepID=A0A931DCM8_9MICC|nr:formylglycine-generating enzyme family protein [Zhihengliuella flava]MBG6084413.1 formylglycine-generating enzyme required for sulfatase activity [Zhihengliuella flava]